MHFGFSVCVEIAVMDSIHINNFIPKQIEIRILNYLLITRIREQSANLFFVANLWVEQLCFRKIFEKAKKVPTL